MITDENVERVAKVLAAHESSKWHWDNDSKYREQCLTKARAAIAAMPSGKDDNWLDEALDSVHPECRVERTIRVAPNLWDVRIAWPLEPISEPHQESVWDRQEGTGTTRKAAILVAVRKAKGASDG